jgi:hypothetical protein
LEPFACFRCVSIVVGSDSMRDPDRHLSEPHVPRDADDRAAVVDYAPQPRTDPAALLRLAPLAERRAVLPHVDKPIAQVAFLLEDADV